MKKEDLKKIVDSYTSKDIDSIIKEFKIITKEEKTLYELVEDKKNKSSNKEKILIGLDNYFEETKDIILKYEYLKPYKYCALFRKTSGDFSAGIDNLRSKVTDSETIKLINEGLPNPKLYELNDCAILKFNYLCKGASLNEVGQAIEEEGILPLTIVIHKQESIVEFRVAKINTTLKNKVSNFYEKRMDELIDWFEEKTIFNIEPINLLTINSIAKASNAIDGIIKDTKGNSIKVYGQKMELKAGSSATLDAGISEDIVLPILGELKLLIKENEKEFSSTHPFYKKLMEFIEVTEEESTYPWVQLIWLNEVKAKQILVKFRFDVLSARDYYIIEFHRNNAGNEEMMKVAKFIENQCRTDSELSEVESTSEEETA